MVHAIPVWELQETWAKIWGMQFFPFFLLSSADLDYTLWQFVLPPPQIFQGGLCKW